MMCVSKLRTGKVNKPALGTCVVLALCAAHAAASLTRAHAQDAGNESPCRCTWGESRKVGDHAFLVPTFVDSALVLSYLGVRAGAELESISDVPVADRSVDVERVVIGEVIDAGIRLFDRVGLFGTVGAIASASTNARSLVARGTDYRLLASGGVIVKLIDLEQTGTTVSLRGSVATESGDIVTLLPLLQFEDDRVIRTAIGLAGNLGDLLITPYSAFRWGGSLAAAQPLSPAFSAQASIGLSVEDAQLDVFDAEENARVAFDRSTLLPELGLALTGDAAPVGIPVAVMLEYRGAFPQIDDDLTDRDVSEGNHTVAVGAYYSGRMDLQTGVVLYTVLDYDPVISQGAPEGGSSPTLMGGRIILRYFW